MQPILLNGRSDASQAGARRTRGRESRMQVLLASGRPHLGNGDQEEPFTVAHVGRPHSTAGISCSLWEVQLPCSVFSRLTATTSGKRVSGGVPKDGLYPRCPIRWKHRALLLYWENNSVRWVSPPPATERSSIFLRISKVTD